MALVRTVELPEGVAGALCLHRMPGRYECLDQLWAELAQLHITRIVCLAPDSEIREKSPNYAAAIATGKVPYPVRHYTIPDYQAPTDLEGFWLLAKETADALREGENVLVHCAGGVGRTGTLAIAILMALGLAPQQAKDTVDVAGSRPENSSQHDALWQMADRYLPLRPDGA